MASKKNRLHKRRMKKRGYSYGKVDGYGRKKKIIKHKLYIRTTTKRRYNKRKR